MEPRPGHGKVVPLHEDGHHDAGRVAITWLEDRHRKGWARAFGELLDSWREGAGPEPDEPLEDGVMDMVAVNAGEWLLARGQIHARGELRNIADHLLGRDGPALTPGQQAWIAQLRQRPLRLYRVTDVRPGEGLTLVDELDPSAEPVSVREISGSQTAQPGLLLGARLMAVDTHVATHFELSGAVYPFDKFGEEDARAAVRDATDAALRLGLPPDKVRDLAEMALARCWMARLFAPPTRPRIRDAMTGEPMLLLTDHYRVNDPQALATALAAQPDVSGDATTGWHRDADSADGLRRSLVAINPGRAADRIEVFYRTQGLADSGRHWLEGLAGPALTHLTREIVDPSSAAHGEPGGRRAAPDEALSPETMAALVDQVMRRHYANWCDEPIPALGGRTPRQAIATPTGLERVKGLLREYEAGERDSAADQDRAPFSFQFLWDELGIRN